MNMSNATIIIQLMFINIFMIFVGLVLNKILGLKKEDFKNLKNQALNLRTRLKNAQLMGDVQMVVQLQQETVFLMKRIMKKQFFPLCMRCVILIAIFSILALIYRDYDSGLLCQYLYAFVRLSQFAIYLCLLRFSHLWLNIHSVYLLPNISSYTPILHPLRLCVFIVASLLRFHLSTRLA